MEFRMRHPVQKKDSGKNPGRDLQMRNCMEELMNESIASTLEWNRIPGVWASAERTLAFLARLPEGSTEIRLAAASVYRLRINGKVCAYGPARAPLGFARIDRIPVSARAGSLISIEVVAYATANFYYPKQAPFLKAAFFDRKEKLLGATGDGITFRLYRLPFRLWNVPKLTHQRDLMEQYDFTHSPDAADWFRQQNPSLENVNEQFIAQMPRLIPRRAPLPSLSTIHEANCTESADLDANKINLEENIPIKLLDACTIGGRGDRYSLYDFGKLYSGFLIAELEAEQESELLIGWDELLIHGKYDPHRAYWANNFIRIRLPAGMRIEFESFEPYAMRCAAFAVLKGKLRIHRVGLREYAFDESHIQLHPGETVFSPEEKAIYAAACETFRQNCVDVFMDCPGRERAAWLCDSYFMAEAEYFLTGRADTEDDFLENFILPEKYPLPESWMLPMCFPSDNPRKTFLPQWSFWLFLEIFEKKRQRGGMDFTEAIRPRLFRFLEGCERYCNREGFLENLPGWNFIEWSQAGEFFQGVHFPTNMLYMKCLQEAGALYKESALLERSWHLREAILRYAFDGAWFHDNATWINGQLIRSGNISEICQYYADFCLSPLPAEPAYTAWKRHLLDGSHAETIVPAAMFIGLILRFKSLLSAGRGEQFLRESTAKLLHMAEETGTLWEKETPTASCCHGFASVLAPLLWKAVKMRENSGSESSFANS